MPKLSAVIITRNEERDIGRTLDAIAFADDILIVDSESTDRTVEVCRAKGARVVQRPLDGFGPQKRFAVSQAQHDWVFCIDADEIVSPELARAIVALLASEPPRPVYRMRWVTVFMGRRMTRGAKEFRVRLFDRRRAGWTDAAVHEEVVFDGPVGTLPGFVLHETTHDLSEAIAKLNDYTTRAARSMQGSRRRHSAAGLALRGGFHFFRHWIIERQVLNGIPGLAWSVLFATGSMIKYLKAIELEQER
jgi:glycosyltransferase involved in cell wall biosynthesis